MEFSINKLIANSSTVQWGFYDPEAKPLFNVSSGDIVEVYNDMGRVEAMAYITNSVKPGHTFMLFGHPKGSVGYLISDHVDPNTTIPYYKGVWANLRKIRSAPEFTEKMTFLPRNIAL